MFNQFSLNEDFKSAAAKWYKDNIREVVDDDIATFKKLRQVRFIQGQESDIQYWEKRGFEAFRSFIQNKWEQWENKNHEKELKKINSAQIKNVFENKEVLVYVPLTGDHSRTVAALEQYDSMTVQLLRCQTEAGNKNLHFNDLKLTKKFSKISMI
jgi:hypothetical protein